MGVFNRTKKYRKSSLELEEKIKLLEKEEKKNIQEIMHTDKMYSIVEPIPEVPPTPAVYTDVPDPNGVRDPAWTQPASGGDESDSATWENGWSDTDYLYNSNEVFGETGRPVLASPPNYTTGVRRFDPGAGLVRAYVGYGPSLGYVGAGNVFKGITYASYWGTMYAAVEENFGGQWTQKPYRAYYDDEKAFMINAYAKMVDMDNRGVATKSIKMWHGYSYFWYGTWENVGGAKRDHPTYGKQVLINASIYTDAEKYESEPWKPHIPAWNQVIQQRALASGNDPENFPGHIDVGSKLFKKSKEAIQKMLEESGEDIAFWGKGSTGGNYDKGFNPDHPDGTQQTNPFTPGTPLYNQFEKHRELQKMKDMGLMGYTGGEDQVAGLFDAIKSSGGGKVPTTKNKAGVLDAKYVEAGMLTPQQFKDKWGMDPRDYENLPQASAGMDGQQIAMDPNASKGWNVNFRKQFGAGGDDGATEVDVKYKDAEIYKYKKGEFQDKKNLDNIDKEVEDKVGGALDDFDVNKGAKPVKFPTQDLGGLGAKDGDQIAWGKPKGPPPTDAKLGRASDMNVVNWYNSGGDVGSKPEGWTMQDVRDYLKNRDKGFQSSKKGNQKVIATSYDPDGNVIYEADWIFAKDPLVKKSDAFGKKQGQKAWFKVKDIQPEYPKKKVPKLKNLRHPKAYENQFSDRAKKIKVSSRDLIRNYKVSTTQIAQYHAMVDIINKFIDDNPERSEMIAKRYPAHDPRLCELNFKLDRMKEASEKYVESKFPENKKVTSRIITILKKNKEMTDPESFTMAPSPPTYSDYQKLKLRESATRYFKKPVQIKSWHKGHLTNP